MLMLIFLVLSMAISGALAAGGAALYWLSGNTEFFWSTYQALPATGFNGIPVALLAVNNPIGVVFSGIFMAMLDIVGLQLTGHTAYNEYVTDVIIAVIVYLSAFSLVIQMWLKGKKKPVWRKEGQRDIHGDFGAFCYQGFRHSLCHGWSAGVIGFLKEENV